MSAGAPVNSDQSEDIDLLLLAERALLYFRRFKWLFLAALLLGLTAGYTFYRVIPKTYRSRLVMHSFLLTNPEQIQIVNNWSQLLREKEYGALSQLLHCPDTLLHGVKKIKAKEIQQVFTTTNPNGFTIDVWVTDNRLLTGLQEGIVYGFENNEYIKQRLDVKKESLRLLISQTESELRKLDSTHTRLREMIFGNRSSSSTLILDMSAINRQLIEIQEKLQSYKENLRFTNGVQVLQSFSPFNNPDGPHLLPWLLIGAIAFTGLAWLISIFYSINQKLRQRSRNH